MVNPLNLNSSISSTSSLPGVNLGTINSKIENNEAISLYNNNNDQVINLIFEIKEWSKQCSKAEYEIWFSSSSIHAWSFKWWLKVELYDTKHVCFRLCNNAETENDFNYQLLIKARKINAIAIKGILRHENSPTLKSSYSELEPSYPTLELSYSVPESSYSEPESSHSALESYSDRTITVNMWDIAIKMSDLISWGAYDDQEDIITFGARITTLNNSRALSIPKYESWMTLPIQQHQEYLKKISSILEEVLHQSSANLSKPLCSIIREYHGGDHCIMPFYLQVENSTVYQRPMWPVPLQSPPPLFPSPLPLP